jgi:hypothetical protein
MFLLRPLCLDVPTTDVRYKVFAKLNLTGADAHLTTPLLYDHKSSVGVIESALKALTMLTFASVTVWSS